MSQKKKGDIVENLVGMLHGFPGVKVEKRVRLPSVRPGSTRRREIDVLVTSCVVGYPVRIAIECKNLRAPVKSLHIDKFLSVLEDVGIPRVNGIFVSASGYRSDALELAQEAGVRPLILEGLNRERLGLEVRSAIQSVVFHVATWECMSQLPGGGAVEFPAPITVVEFPQGLGEGTPAILNLLFLLWRDAQIPAQLGKHHLAIKLPRRFRFSRAEEPVLDCLVMLTYRVEALVGTVQGTASSALLWNATDSSLEKLHVSTDFEAGDEPLQLRRFESEEDLDKFLSPSSTRLVTRVKVPRIVSESSFWPPSRHAVEAMKRIRARGEKPTFERVEGVNINRAWDPLYAIDE